MRGRDADTARPLDEAAWLLLVVWEHEDPIAASEAIAKTVEARRARPALQRSAGSHIPNQ